MAPKGRRSASRMDPKGRRSLTPRRGGPLRMRYHFLCPEEEPGCLTGLAAGWEASGAYLHQRHQARTRAAPSPGAGPTPPPPSAGSNTRGSPTRARLKERARSSRP
eukprot:1185457-Prorocentrum_minimum.AAC.4